MNKNKILEERFNKQLQENKELKFVSMQNEERCRQLELDLERQK